MLYFNLISLALIAGGALVLAAQAGQIAASARIYPLVLIALVVVLSLVVAAKEIAGRAATAPLDPQLERVLRAPPALRMRLAAFVVVWLIYPWALPGAGFIVATTCALSASLWLLRIRRPLLGIVVGLVFSVAFSVVFTTVLFIPTPAGPLDELLTRLIYALRH